LDEAVVDEVAVEEVAPAPTSELFGDCSQGGGSGRGRVGVASRCTRVVLDAVRRR
jgi:hypothetical protein